MSDLVNTHNYYTQQMQVYNSHLPPQPVDSLLPYYLKTAGGMYWTEDGKCGAVGGAGGMYKTFGPNSEKLIAYFRNANPVVCEQTKIVWIKEPVEDKSKIVNLSTPLLQNNSQRVVHNSNNSIVYPKPPITGKWD